jgi:hypothetical protein
MKQTRPSYNVQTRRKGLLPIVKIAGEAFEVDTDNRRLKLISNPTVTIDIRQMTMTSDGERIFCFYMPASHKIVRLEYATAETPKGIVLLEMPNEFRLDPVGWALRYGIEEMRQLKEFAKMRRSDIKTKSLFSENATGQSSRSQQKAKKGRRPARGRRQPP